MLRCLRDIDEALFSPPHRFETILAYVWSDLCADYDAIEQDSDDDKVAADLEKAGVVPANIKPQ
jgi:hypothetical protein